MSDKNYSGRPASGVDLLQILFIYLKLTNQITWSWFWVLSPIWVMILVSFVLFIWILVRKDN